MNWVESSLNDLYKSAVDAFPETTRRQHSTNSVKIVQLKWTPFLGMKTLLVRGMAQNEDREYNTLVLFKGVRYGDADTPDLVPLMANDGVQYFLEQLSAENNDVLVRCNCADFAWRGNFYNHLDKSLHGRKRRKYESLGINPPVNPTKSPMLCKHLMKMMKTLEKSGILWL